MHLRSAQRGRHTHCCSALFPSSSYAPNLIAQSCYSQKRGFYLAVTAGKESRAPSSLPS